MLTPHIQSSRMQTRLKMMGIPTSITAAPDEVQGMISRLIRVEIVGEKCRTGLVRRE
jgi:hypothetical protein